MLHTDLTQNSDLTCWEWTRHRNTHALFHDLSFFMIIRTLIKITVIRRGTAVAQWLRCFATNRKVAGSIPDGVNGIFH